MRTEILSFEAEECRRLAAAEFHARPEGPFLLRLARMFDDLSRQPASASASQWKTQS
jgi:hypothetical protein